MPPLAARFTTTFLSLIVAVLSSACRDLEPVSGPSLPLSTSRSAVQELPHETLARGLALALDDASLRGRLIRAMRLSGFTEHKLVFQDFAETRTGRDLVAAGADRLEITREDLRGKIASLPGPMDFYIPFESQRKRWAGSGDILVAAFLDVDATRVRAFDPTGASHLLSEKDPIPSEAIIVLHPAEPKSLHDRVSAQRSTIEDPEESGYSPSDDVQLSTTCDRCVDIPFDGSTGGGETRVESLTLRFGDGWLAGRSEVEFRTGSVLTGTSFTSREIDDLEKNVTYRVDVKIHDETPSSTNKLIAHLWELDSFVAGGDKAKGEATITGKLSPKSCVEAAEEA